MATMSHTVPLQESRESEKQALELKQLLFKAHDDEAIKFHEETFNRQTERSNVIMEELNRLKKQWCD